MWALIAVLAFIVIVVYSALIVASRDDDINGRG